MRISPDWKTFHKLLERAFPTPNKIVQEEMEYGDDVHDDVIDMEVMVAPEE